MTDSEGAPYGRCAACGQALPPQEYAGNPRRYGCEACRVWHRRHPGEKRVCTRCDRPPDPRKPLQVWTSQSDYRTRVLESRGGSPRGYVYDEQ